MDLILLEPGDPAAFNAKDGAAPWDGGGSLIDDDSVTKATGKLGYCIELLSISQGMKQQITTDVSNSARTSGRAMITEFTCVKYVDKNSVYMYKNCLNAKSISGDSSKPTMLHILRNTAENAAPILTFSLRDAIISEVHFQTHPDDMPTEQFKLSFTEILWHYTVQKPDGLSLAGNVQAGWSLARNRAIGQFTK